MTTALNDDHGDRFPGAVPAPTPVPTDQDRHVRMHAAYVHKVNAVVASGDDDLAHELARTFEEETSASARTHADRRTAGRRTPGRGDAARRPGRVGSFARRSLQRFDRYTLEVFNAGTPSRER
ncbi:hypothetical protein [Blastococcus litoris]|uniref:hypothetical protein n=1 Tax=Blastococcus litoris TaxID=2171622 RepID=UPI000E301383|nr:hypothetical protein [Blastococcus litoris]